MIDQTLIVARWRKLLRTLGLCLALPVFCCGDILNTASFTVDDSAGISHSGVSNTVTITYITVPPVASLASVSPAAATIGDPDLTIDLAGVFPSDAEVHGRGGAVLASTWLSVDRMTALIPAADLASTGSFDIFLRSVSTTVSGAVPFKVVDLPFADFGASRFTLPLKSTLALARSSGVLFTWTFTAIAGSTAPAPSAAGSRTGASSARTITSSPQLSLGLTNLSPGNYQVSVVATNAAAKQSAPAVATLALITDDMGSARVYPNPWRVARGDGMITFDLMPLNSQVKIFTVSGRWLRTLDAAAGSASWDLKNDSGDQVASGIYLYLLTSPAGGKGRGIVTIIR
jgi:hypothetical protein